MSRFLSLCLFLGALVLPSISSGFDNLLIRPGPGWIPKYQPTIFVRPIQNQGFGWGQKENQKRVVSFFQNRYCQGGETVISVGSGECINLPREICDWNLSLKTYGSCIEVFESEGCKVSPRRSYKYGLLNGGQTGSKIFRANVCQSTKLNGFDVVRSFRRCNC